MNDLLGILSITALSVNVEFYGISNTIFHNPDSRMWLKLCYGCNPLSIELSYIPTLSFETLTLKNYCISFLEAASRILGIILKLNLPANLNTLNILKGSSLKVI